MTILLGVQLLVSILGGANLQDSVSYKERPRTIHEFLSLDARMRVIAHRGASGLAPENTRAAFLKAMELGADMFELDVLLSRDGELVVIHDDTLERTTNGEGRVKDFSLAELRELDAGSWFDPVFAGEVIPTLAEVLEMARGRILVNVEIKTEAVYDEPRGGIAEKVVRLINDLGMREEVIVSSFDPRALDHVRQLDPRVSTASLYEKDLHAGQGPLEIMEAVSSVAFNVGKSHLTRDMVEECHKNRRPVAVYTVNSPQEMEELMRRGVNALFTDRPDLLLELLESP